MESGTETRHCAWYRMTGEQRVEKKVKRYTLTLTPAVTDKSNNHRGWRERSSDLY
jgi:hypothetical protein